jgi:hypothetical protein
MMGLRVTRPETGTRALTNSPTRRKKSRSSLSVPGQGARWSRRVASRLRLMSDTHILGKSRSRVPVLLRVHPAPQPPAPHVNDITGGAASQCAGAYGWRRRTRLKTRFH